MAYQATVYQVFIASPSDVMDERDAITKTINSWNNLNSHDLGITVLPVKWETNATPELGDRPQALINKNLCAHSDILIGVFWTRIGSPSGVSESGTIEEIENFKKANKHVMLYFSKKHMPHNIDVDQYKRVRDFEDRIKSERWGIIDSFTTTDELEEKLTAHLTRVIRKTKLESFPTELVPIVMHDKTSSGQATTEEITSDAPHKTLDNEKTQTNLPDSNNSTANNDGNTEIHNDVISVSSVSSLILKILILLMFIIYFIILYLSIHPTFLPTFLEDQDNRLLLLGMMAIIIVAIGFLYATGTIDKFVKEFCGH